MIFTLKIELGNDAMQMAGDVADALRKTADRLGVGEFLGPQHGRIMDLNGNTVGSWEVK